MENVKEIETKAGKVEVGDTIHALDRTFSILQIVPEDSMLIGKDHKSTKRVAIPVDVVESIEPKAIDI